MEADELRYEWKRDICQLGNFVPSLREELGNWEIVIVKTTKRL
jgi:hypothetical protein